MRVLINPITSKNNYYTPQFKAKKINLPMYTNEKAMEMFFAAAGMLGLSGLISNTKEKDVEKKQLIERVMCVIEEALEKNDENYKKENLPSIVDFVNHIADNIDKIHIDDLSDYLTYINTKTLKYAKALSAIFPELDKNSVEYLKNFNHNIETKDYWKIREPQINGLNLPPEDLIQLIELVEHNSKNGNTIRSVDNFLYSDSSEFDIKDLRASVFMERYQEIIDNNFKHNQYVRNIKQKFMNETYDLLKTNIEDLDPFMINSFIYNIDTHNKKSVKYLCSNSCYKFSPDISLDIKTRSALARCCMNGSSNSNGLEKFINELVGKNCPPNLIEHLAVNFIYFLPNLDKEEKSKVLSRVADYYDLLNNNKEKYLNSKSQNILDNFISEYRKELMYATYVYDDETMKTLFSKRFDNVKHYLNSFQFFQNRRLDLLKDLTECRKTDGKELTPNEKLQLLQLVNAFSYSLDIGVEKLYESVDKGVIDLKELQVDLFRQIIRFLDFSESEVRSFPEDKILEWNFEYLPLLFSTKDKNEEAFTHLVKAATSDSYIDYLLDKNNEYGIVNSKTKKLYNEKGIDFEKTLNPSKENEVRFLAKDENLEILSNSVIELMENIIAIRFSPLKSFFDKRYEKFIKNDAFILPENISKSKEDLKNFAQNMLTQLEPAWKQAEKNLNTNRKLTAQNTLTIKDHLETILSNIKSIESEKIEKNSRSNNKNVG